MRVIQAATWFKAEVRQNISKSRCGGLVFAGNGVGFIGLRV